MLNLIREELLEVDLFLNRAGRKLHEPFKGKPLEGVDEQMSHDDIV